MICPQLFHAMKFMLEDTQGQTVYRIKTVCLYKIKLKSECFCLDSLTICGIAFGQAL